MFTLVLNEIQTTQVFYSGVKMFINMIMASVKVILVLVLMKTHVCGGQDSLMLARLTGDHVQFDVEDGDLRFWQYQSLQGNPVNVWGQNDGYFGRYESPKYTVDNTGNLHVSDLQPIDAGEYVATIVPNSRSFDLLVADEADCGEMGSAEIGEQLVYECTVLYYGGSTRFQPTLKWYDVVEVEDGVDSTREEIGGVMSVRSTLTVDSATREYDDKEYRCSVSFNREVDISQNVSTHCTQKYSIEHAVSMIEFYHDENHTDRIRNDLGDTPRLEEDSFIFVKSDGQPQPDIDWYCNGESTPSHRGASLEIIGRLLRGTDDLNRCQVNASNTLNNGVPVTQTIEFFGIADDRGSGGNDGNTGSKAGNAGAVAAAILIPIIIVVIVVVVGSWFILKKRRARREEANGSAEKAPQKTPYENKNFQGSEVDMKNAAQSNGPPPGYTPSEREVNPNATPYGGGGPAPNSYPGKPSPGYGDLGVKHLSGSVPGLNESIESLPDPGHRGGPHPVSTDPRGPGVDPRAAPLGQRGSPMGHHGPPMGHHRPPMDHRAPPMGHHGPPMDHRAPPPSDIRFERQGGDTQV